MTRLLRAGLALAFLGGVGCGEASRPLADTVAPVFDAHCSSCHDAAAPVNGLALGPASAVPADALAAGMVGVPSRELPSMPLVTAGDPSRSYLLHKIEGSQEALGCPGSCVARMPPAGPPLSDAEIEAVRAWIAGGATAE